MDTDLAIIYCADCHSFSNFMRSHSRYDAKVAGHRAGGA